MLYFKIPGGEELPGCFYALIGKPGHSGRRQRTVPYPRRSCGRVLEALLETKTIPASEY